MKIKEEYMYQNAAPVNLSDSTFENAGSLLAELGLEININDRDLLRIPKTGRVLFVSNRPNPLINEICLHNIISLVREDFRVLATGKAYKEIKHRIEKEKYFFLQAEKIAVPATKSNSEPYLHWLKADHALCIFPGKTEKKKKFLKSKLHLEKNWSKLIGKMARETETTVIPVFFPEKLNEKELFANNHGRKIKVIRKRMVKVILGSPIEFNHYSAIKEDNFLTEYFRFRTFILHYRKEPNVKPLSFPEKLKMLPFSMKTKSKAVIPAVAIQDMEEDIGKLQMDQLLLATEEFNVYAAPYHQIPNVMKEIGRLRELTFRQIGEGTGNHFDIDRFDTYYTHLFLWHNTKREVAGAYRIGLSDKIISNLGKNFLYTSSLFKYKNNFISELGPALEMGRSFIRTEYQDNFVPFLNLWKGIARFIGKNPQYKMLFGPVSISNEYHTMSRQIMVRFLEYNHSYMDRDLKVKPKLPLKFKTKELKNKVMEKIFRSLEDISGILQDIESSNGEIPPLLRQYLNLGGRIVTFNVDPKFNNALDGLIIVDLTLTPKRLLKFYMGEDYLKFLQYHHLKEYEDLLEG
jgi:putative hemolysin